MDSSRIEDFFNRHQKIHTYLLDQDEVTFASDVHDGFRRTLVLAIASFFEAEVTGIIRKLPKIYAASNPLLSALIDQKVVARQYHTYFRWDGNNANSFFALFGQEFKVDAAKIVNQDEALQQSIEDFLILGDTRNRLVHTSYITFDFDKSPDDIMRLFRSAVSFLDFLEKQLIDTAPASQPGVPPDLGNE